MRQGDTCAWVPDAASGPGTARASTPLTGLAHGAAGIGLALFELHAATGRYDFLETARGAIHYEDSLFDHHQGNWPDLRTMGRPDVSDTGRAFALAWCHGARDRPLRGSGPASWTQTLGSRISPQPGVAITTTLAAIDEKLEHPRADATLCRGSPG